MFFVLGGSSRSASQYSKFEVQRSKSSFGFGLGGYDVRVILFTVHKNYF